MSDDQSLSAEAVVFGEGALIGLALAGSCFNDFPPKVTGEFLFPAHVSFYLLTYGHKYPGATFLRKFLCTYFLVFGDLLLTHCVLCKPLPETWMLYQLLFLMFFVGLHFVDPRSLREEFTNHVLRGAMFLGESVYKAVVLIDSLQPAMAHGGYWGIALAVCVGVCRLCAPALIYALDQYPRVPLQQNAALVRFLRSSPLISLALVALLRYFPFTPHENEKVFAEAHLVTSLAFMVWYGVEAAYYIDKEEKKE